MRKLQFRKTGLLLAMILLLLQTGCGSLPSENAVDPSAQSQDTITPVSLEVQITPVSLESSVTAISPAGSEEASVSSSEMENIQNEALIEASAETELPEWLPEEGEYYYDVENVVLYLYLYDELPENYITKAEARELGWEGGSVEKYLEGAAIGGDTFGNREGLLPEAEDRDYTECDIDTDGAKSRGAKRLVFSDDGLYYYTEDHYESFDEVIVTEAYEVIW